MPFPKGKPNITTSQRRRTVKRPLRFLVALFVILHLIMGVGYGAYQWQLSPLGADGAEEIAVVIPPNTSAADVGEMLAEKKLIRSALAFRLYTRNQDTNLLKAGEYNLRAALSIPEIVDILKEGKTRVDTVTIPEGYTLSQITRLLVERNIVDPAEWSEALMKTEFEAAYLPKPSNNPKRLEGFLFPATYRIARTATETDIVRMMVDRFDQEMTPQVREQIKQSRLTVAETVTLASLVEREAQKAEERPVIAKVFLNRLGKNMRLEACSTVQYLLDQPKAKLYYKDLEIESPYNTYKYSGLPPGPIANPGRESLQAVLAPANVDYLFFVAKGDGYHQFSRTLAEHEKAVKQYVR
ncbi:endolytic transglycosylase MltG [Heliophilum fasciatum]|uniref:Endolytic murein transglycosylase n=1 Tax=Heliophilum fasciatum TaxID=35700 RepID=A0A4R2RMT7_9FIRM|nr:endolytic transglycosylase MltG [Heliophilum fasciatum]MCW2278036.1 UPF0755 protein [Heliophilum fasciatum]TCP64344.1 UPF0755 protein [Heliophilum fasciatum]